MGGLGDISRSMQSLCARHVPRLIREQGGTEAARKAIRTVGPIRNHGYQVGAPGTGDPLSPTVYPDYDDAVTAAGQLGGIVVRARKPEGAE